MSRSMLASAEVLSAAGGEVAVLDHRLRYTARSVVTVVARAVGAVAMAVLGPSRVGGHTIAVPAGGENPDSRRRGIVTGVNGHKLLKAKRPSGVSVLDMTLNRPNLAHPEATENGFAIFVLAIVTDYPLHLLTRPITKFTSCHPRDGVGTATAVMMVISLPPGRAAKLLHMCGMWSRSAAHMRYPYISMAA